MVHLIKKDDFPTESEWMENWNALYTQSGLNAIRQLIDRDTDYSEGSLEGFAEAYVNNSGRRNTVTYDKYGADGAIFSGNGFVPGINDKAGNGTTTTFIEKEGDSPNFDGSWNNTSNYYDGTSSPTFWEYLPENDTDRRVERLDVYLEETFNSQFVNRIYYDLYLDGQWSQAPYFQELRFEFYDGSSWNTLSVLDDQTEQYFSQYYEGTLSVNKSIQGLRLRLDIQAREESYNSLHLYDTKLEIRSLKFGPAGNGVISHNVASKFTSSDDTTVIGVPFVEQLDSGGSVEYRLTNSSEQTNWYSCLNPEVLEFSSFNNRPDNLDVRIIPNTNQPSNIIPNPSFESNPLSDWQSRVLNEDSSATMTANGSVTDMQGGEIDGSRSVKWTLSVTDTYDGGDGEYYTTIDASSILSISVWAVPYFNYFEEQNGRATLELVNSAGTINVQKDNFEDPVEPYQLSLDVPLNYRQPNTEIRLRWELSMSSSTQDIEAWFDHIQIQTAATPKLRGFYFRSSE